MEFTDIVKQRYATKKFTGEKIAEDKIEQLKELMQLAPTSFNSQPWHALIVTDQEIKKQLLEHSWNQPQVTTCSHLFVLCARTDIMELADKLEQQAIDAGTPAEKAKGFVDMFRGFINNFSDEQKLAWAQRQTYIALANGLNGAKDLGFDSCPMEGFKPEEYAKILGTPEHIVPTVLMPVGVAADEPRPKSRFDLDFMFD